MSKEVKNQEMIGDTVPQRGSGIALEMYSLVKSNIRQYAMYITLVAIFIIFNIQTNGLFLSSRNISNLILQTGYVAILAIGMTLILIIRHIDLSVGFVAGFTGAVSALLMKEMGVNQWVAILIVLVIGLFIGLYQGTLVAYVKVPAFVVTLAGMFIFRGLLLLVTKGTGSIIVDNEKNPGYFAISNSFIPDKEILFGGYKLHIITILVGLFAVALVVFFQFKARKNKRKYDFAVSSTPIFSIGLIVISGIIMSSVFLLATYNGLPWTAVIVGVVLLIFNFILNKTALGRYIYGIGGNPDASELSGVNVKKVTMFCFASMGALSALAGIIFTSRIQTAGPSAGVGFELDAIASAFIGGVAVTGGVGKVTNTLIGALVIMSLTSGFLLMNVDVAFQYIAKGVIFIIAVAFDVITRKKRA